MIIMEENRQTRLLTVGEVSEILNMSEVTVKRLLRQKMIPGYKISGSWRVNRTELEAFIAKQRNIQEK